MARAFFFFIAIEEFVIKTKCVVGIYCKFLFLTTDMQVSSTVDVIPYQQYMS